MTLLKWELKRVFKSLIFWMTAVILILIISGQIQDAVYQIQRPSPSEEFYGKKQTKDQVTIYSNLVHDLQRSIENNYFDTYPYGFYRGKSLDPQELEMVKKIFSAITNTEYQNIVRSGNFSAATLDDFEEKLNLLDGVLGGGSFFAPKSYKFFYGQVNMDYEEALEEYELMEKNGLDVAFSRYFSDYTGLFTVLLSWFVGIFIWSQDQKRSISGTLYTKSFSNGKLVFTRILAVSLSLMFIILLLYTFYEIQMIRFYSTNHLHIFKSYALVVLWIFPGIFFVSSLCSFLMLLSGNLFLGILAPMVTLFSIFAGSKNLYGNYGWSLVLRHNTIGNEAYFLEHFHQLCLNRFLWTILSIVFCFLATALLNKKREGKYGFKLGSSKKRHEA